MLEEAGYEVVEGFMIPDGIEELSKQLIRLADQRQVNVVFTTGGTGFSERDLTPEATIAVCDRMAPGIAEAIRAYSMTKTPTAMLSRATAGMRNETLIINLPGSPKAVTICMYGDRVWIRKKTLIINLPGSPKAVRECMEFIMHPLEHGLEIMLGRTGECARH